MGNMSYNYMCTNRHGMYYARFIIPKHLQPYFNNKKEIRRSLQTDSRKLAIKRARIYRVEFAPVPKLQLGNPVVEALASRLFAISRARYEFRPWNSGSWSFLLEVPKLELGNQRNIDQILP